jgi:hypothetical protein
MIFKKPPKYRKYRKYRNFEYQYFYTTIPGVLLYQPNRQYNGIATFAYQIGFLNGLGYDPTNEEDNTMTIAEALLVKCTDHVRDRTFFFPNYEMTISLGKKKAQEIYSTYDFPNEVSIEDLEKIKTEKSRNSMTLKTFKIMKTIKALKTKTKQLKCQFCPITLLTANAMLFHEHSIHSEEIKSLLSCHSTTGNKTDQTGPDNISGTSSDLNLDLIDQHLPWLQLKYMDCTSSPTYVQAQAAQISKNGNLHLDCLIRSLEKINTKESKMTINMNWDHGTIKMIPLDRTIPLPMQVQASQIPKDDLPTFVDPDQDHDQDQDLIIDLKYSHSDFPMSEKNEKSKKVKRILVLDQVPKKTKKSKNCKRTCDRTFPTPEVLVQADQVPEEEQVPEKNEKSKKVERTLVLDQVPKKTKKSKNCKRTWDRAIPTPEVLVQADQVPEKEQVPEKNEKSKKVERILVLDQVPKKTKKSTNCKRTRDRTIPTHVVQAAQVPKDDPPTFVDPAGPVYKFPVDNAKFSKHDPNLEVNQFDQSCTGLNINKLTCDKVRKKRTPPKKNLVETLRELENLTPAHGQVNADNKMQQHTNKHKQTKKRKKQKQQEQERGYQSDEVDTANTMNYRRYERLLSDLNKLPENNCVEVRNKTENYINNF